jgi:Ca-activated chloride channel family protein
MSEVNRPNENDRPKRTRSKRRRSRRWIFPGVLVVLLGSAGYYYVFGLPSAVSWTSRYPGPPKTSKAPPSPVTADKPPALPTAPESPSKPRSQDATATEPNSTPPAPEALGADKGIEIGIAYGTEKRSWLEWAVKEFSSTDDGRNIRVNLIPMGSMEAAHAILKGDKQIHVWSPASRLYTETFLRDWEARQKGKPILKQEYLALTPLVFVMWKSRYEAFKVKCPDVSFRTIGYAIRARSGWGAIAGKPEWGRFKFSHTHPNQSNSGLVSLLLLAYEFQEKTTGMTVSDLMTQEFQDYLAKIEQGVIGLQNSTGNLMRDMVLRGPSNYDAVMVYESVAIDFFESAEGRWGPLQVIYPKFNFWSDNPYYILNTPWTTAAHQKAADTFLKYLMSEPVQLKALTHGFRPGNPLVAIKGATSPFTRYEKYGLKLDVPLVCETPSLEVIENLQQSWERHVVPQDGSGR